MVSGLFGLKGLVGSFGFRALGFCVLAVLAVGPYKHPASHQRRIRVREPWDPVTQMYVNEQGQEAVIGPSCHGAGSHDFVVEAPEVWSGSSVGIQHAKVRRRPAAIPLRLL